MTITRNIRPIRVVNSARVLQTPPVQRIHSVQPVDLNPRGATIAVDVQGQNPFEDMAGIEVVTQASGGMAAADESQSSRSVLSHEVAPVTYSMIPGMGSEIAGTVPVPTASNPTGTPIPTNNWTNLLETVAGGYSQNMAAKKAEADAKAAQAIAEAEKYKYQGGLTTTQAMAAHKGISAPLLGVAALAIGIGIYLKMSGKNRKIGGRRKSKKRR